jgi:hypothetical protein
MLGIARLKRTTIVKANGCVRKLILRMNRCGLHRASCFAMFAAIPRLPYAAGAGYGVQHRHCFEAHPLCRECLSSSITSALPIFAAGAGSNIAS